MIISDLSYLEVVSEVSSIVGGQTDKDDLKPEKIIKQKNVNFESDSITIVVEQSVRVTSGNKVVVVSTYAVEN